MGDQNKPVGLIGVGLLGSAIAERLLDNGYLVNGHDSNSRQLEPMIAAGGRRCRDAADLFDRCHTIILSLPDSAVSKHVLIDNINSLHHGHTVIDTTTGNPDEMIAIHDMLRNKRCSYVEATVAGSSAQVRSGDALLFVGGDDQTIQTIHELLNAISTKHYSLGPVGSASRFKLVHNLVLGLNRAVLAEGLTFASALGFDPARSLEILLATPAASCVMQTKGLKMVARDYQPQARLSQHLKDVRLIVAAARQLGLELPLSLVHQELLEQAESLGFGTADNSAVLEAYRQRSGDSP